MCVGTWEKPSPSSEPPAVSLNRGKILTPPQVIPSPPTESANLRVTLTRVSERPQPRRVRRSRTSAPAREWSRCLGPLDLVQVLRDYRPGLLRSVVVREPRCGEDTCPSHLERSTAQVHFE